MNWVDKWLYGKVRDMWDNRHKYEADKQYKEERALKMVGAQLTIEKSRAEGENRISFELSSAVGGKILNVRHYDPRQDRHESQTYVIPAGDDIGERVAKIINLEMFKQ
jgi:hypothetical protein